MDIEKILSEMTLKEKAEICSGADFWHTKAIERLKIPSIMMCDGSNGLRKQIGKGDHLGINESLESVCYPAVSALACTFDREAVKELGEILGVECQSEGIDMLLGPGLNIKRSPLGGRNFEYFSEDPFLAGELGAAYVQGLQSKGVSACVKHFACNNQETMRMVEDSQVEERVLHEIYLVAFENAIKKGKARSIMCAYNALNGEFCTENKVLLTDILRKKWGFAGITVTDWGAIKDRSKGISAGLNLEMPGGNPEAVEELVNAVKTGKIQEETIDNAVRRILEFIKEAIKDRSPDTVSDRTANRKIARRLAAEGGVLLTNDGILPLKKEQKVAFIGEFARCPRFQGAGSSHVNADHSLGAEALSDEKRIVYSRGYNANSSERDAKLFEEAVRLAKNSDIAVIFAGLPESCEAEGVDREDMMLPDNQNDLICAVANVNPHTVVVLYSGSCVELPWKNRVSAILTMYLGGEQVGPATVDILYGDVNPCGHLAETWPLKLSDNPSYLNFPGYNGVVTYAEGLYVGYRYYDKKGMAVNFPFGHGLSYTTFTYSNLSSDKKFYNDRDCVHISCDVTNTGSLSGKAVVQIYVRDVQSSVSRPIRELKGFEKVYLEPGQTQTIYFEFDKRAFAYYEPACSDWYVESGEFIIEVGENSRNLSQSISVYIEGTKEIPVKVTANTTIGQLIKCSQKSDSAECLINQVVLAAKKTSMADNSVMKKMLMELPLRAAVNYGWISTDDLTKILDSYI